MSFEAVPCMFKQRQEDGAEVGLFGLLIRPSPSSNIIPTEDQKQQQQIPSSSSSSSPIADPQLASSIAALAGTSSIQIVPSDAKNNDHQNLNIKRTAQRPIAFVGPQMVQRRGPFPLSAPPRMPPILPRPKKSAQKAIAKMILPITTTPSIGNTENITAQSPSQVVPQIGAGNSQVEILSIATTSSASIGSVSSISPVSSNSIRSPSAAKREKCGKKQQKRAEEKVGERREREGGKLAKTMMAANKKRRRLQKEKQGGVGGLDQHQQQNNNPIHQNHHLDSGGGMLGEDLHSIEYSQLVNSTVITTEDYLPSQSEPIYTNLDMYNPGQGPSHQNAHSNHSNHHFADPPIPVPPSHSIPGQQQQLCPSAIYIHNQQQQQQHFPCPTSSSSSNSQTRFIGPSNAQIHPPPYIIPQSGQSSSHQQSSSQAGWHPYLVAHPGGSHISSTPDSGIQSIDGSPPSVYTPPMVSPYSSQVRSCESIGPNGHCNNGGGGNLLNNGGHPPPPPVISTAYSHSSHSNSTAQMNGVMGQGETTLLLMSSNGNGNCQHQLTPHSTMQMAPIQQQHLAPAPSKLVNNGGNERENEGEENGPNDFSDMPKLIPVTQMMENDEAIEGGEQQQQQQKKPSLEEKEELAMENVASTSSMAIKTTTTPSEVFFNSEMNLQELAECLSSRMPPEQLKKLTSLIQSKTTSCANNNSKLVEKIGSEGEKLAATVESQQKKRKEKKANNILEVQQKGSKSVVELAIKKNKKEKREKEKMVTSKQSTELKTKCENIDTKVHSKWATTQQQQNQTLNSIKNDNEDEILKRKEKKEEKEEKERIEQLIAHRKRVKAQLNRKLDEFTERVRQQVDETHLNIRNEHYWPMERKFPLRKLDWNEVEKRMTQKENRIGIEEKKVAKKRGRKRKGGGKEIEKRKRKKNMKEEENGRKKTGRKRKRMEDDEKEMRRRKRTRLSGSREKIQREKAVDKQKTPPIILKLPNMLNRKKSHPPSDRPSPRGSSNEMIGRRKMALKQQIVASTPSSLNNNCHINKKEIPSPPNIFADQLAIIRSRHSFLPRNLKRKAIEGRMGNEKRRMAEGKDSIQVGELLEQIFDDFRKICRQKGVSKRHIHQLKRTIGMLFTQQSTNQSSASILLDQYDRIIKQMISTSKIANLRMAYLQLKRSANFEIVRPQLQKEYLQMFTEDRRRSIHSHLPSSTHSSPSKGIIESAITAQRPLTVDTNLDLSYMDSEHPVGRWDPDKEAKLSPNSDNREHDCVRCICGMAEDDGVMTQCDECHFWLHADCLDNLINEDQEYICDFCTRRLETTPRVDIVLRPQPEIKFSGCTYYRTLVNARGLQIRLNEAIYVERLINDKHKKILRELHEECVRKQQNAQQIQSPIKKNEQNEDCEEERRPLNEWWTAEGKKAMADRREFHRRDLRVFRVERLFISPNGQRFIFGCYYARPHETFCDSNRMFYRNELFWTPLFDTLPLDSVVGRCLILEPQIWAMGRPKSPRYLEDDVYCCEYQIDRNQRSFEKIQPKNRYYINTEPYVFNTFAQKLPMKRDFTPFQLGYGHESSSEGANVMQNNSSPKKYHSNQQAMMALAIDQRKLHQNNLEMIYKRIIGRRKEWLQKVE